MADEASNAEGTGARMRREELRHRNPLTNRALLANAQRAADRAGREAERARRAEGRPRAFH